MAVAARWDFDDVGLPAVEADVGGNWPLDITYGNNGGNAAIFVPGAIGNALNFNNSNSYLSRSFAAGQAYWSALVAGEFTIEGYFKDVSLVPVGWYPIFAADLSPRVGIYQRFGIRVVSATDIRLWINRSIAGGGESYQETAPIAAMTNSVGWHSLAVVKRNNGGLNDYQFFVDGVLATSLLGIAACVPPSSGAVLVSLGAAQNGTGVWAEFWPNQMDVVRISDTALVASGLLPNNRSGIGIALNAAASVGVSTGAAARLGVGLNLGALATITAAVGTPVRLGMGTVLGALAALGPALGVRQILTDDRVGTANQLAANAG